jgi:pilus assembly protein CpaC
MCARCNNVETISFSQSRAERTGLDGMTTVESRVREARAWLRAGLFAGIVWVFGAGASLADDPVPPEMARHINETISHITDPQTELRIENHHSKVITFRTPLLRVSVANPNIVESSVFGTHEMELIAKSVGATSVTVWTGDERRPEILSFVVHVDAASSGEYRRIVQFRKLEKRLAALFPNSNVRLHPIADKLIVKGQARDAEEANQILSVLRSGNNGSQSGLGGWAGGNVSSDGRAADPAGSETSDGIPDTTIISLLRVPGEHQVMLRVRIAELKRSAVRSIGVTFDAEVGDFIFGSALGGAANAFISGTFNEDQFNVTLEALEQHRVAKILAQPTLVTLSGRTANFISGGEFAVPTAVGVGGVEAATTYFRGFGTILNFTPTVIDKDRIRIEVNPTFSTLNNNNIVQGIFGIDTRSTSTTVELREGQVLAIAGLTQQQQGGETSRIPGLGEWPLLGTLFNRREASSDETELLIVISPEIVHPMEASEAPTLLPGMEVTEPTDREFYFRNRIEGRPGHHHRATVWPNYRDQLMHPQLYFDTFENGARYYMSGRVGFSN